MPARLTKRQADTCVSAIRTSLIIKKLEGHILNGDEMSSTQVRAAEILLNRTVPTLSAVQLTGADDGPVQFSVNVRFVEPDGH